MELINVGEKVAKRLMVNRRMPNSSAASSHSAPPPPSPAEVKPSAVAANATTAASSLGSTAAEEIIFQPRTFMTWLDEDDKKHELSKYISMSMRVSPNSPFGYANFAGLEGEQYVMTHHPLEWTAYERGLHTQKDLYSFFFTDEFPYTKSPILRAQLTVASGVAVDFIENLPWGSIISYPISRWSQTTGSSLARVFRQTWFGAYLFGKSHLDAFQ